MVDQKVKGIDERLKVQELKDPFILKHEQQSGDKAALQCARKGSVSSLTDSAMDQEPRVMNRDEARDAILKVCAGRRTHEKNADQGILKRTLDEAQDWLPPKAGVLSQGQAALRTLEVLAGMTKEDIASTRVGFDKVKGQGAFDRYIADLTTTDRSILGMAKGVSSGETVEPWLASAIKSLVANGVSEADKKRGFCAAQLAYQIGQGAMKGEHEKVFSALSLVQSNEDLVAINKVLKEQKWMKLEWLDVGQAVGIGDTKTPMTTIDDLLDRGISDPYAKTYLSSFWKNRFLLNSGGKLTPQDQYYETYSLLSYLALGNGGDIKTTWERVRPRYLQLSGEDRKRIEADFLRNNASSIGKMNEIAPVKTLDATLHKKFGKIS